MVKAIVRVSDRRWDLHFHNKIKVKLPANHVEEALQLLQALDQKDKILSKDLKTIDLRFKDKVIVSVSPKVRQKIQKTTKGKIV